jgi:hypothetical protein
MKIKRIKLQTRDGLLIAETGKNGISSIAFKSRPRDSVKTVRYIQRGTVKIALGTVVGVVMTRS